MEMVGRGNLESGIWNLAKPTKMTIANQGCWFQKQALERLKSSTFVLYIVTITLTHHLIVLWSSQGVGVIYNASAKACRSGQVSWQSRMKTNNNRAG